MIDWSKPIEFVDPAIKHIPIIGQQYVDGCLVSIIDKQMDIAFTMGYSKDGICRDIHSFVEYLVKSEYVPTLGSVNNVSIRNKELSTNEELDEVLGELKNDYPKEQVTPEDTLEQSLSRIHRDLKDTLLRVEAQAFAVWVKKRKGTDIAEDYYQFRKHG